MYSCLITWHSNSKETHRRLTNQSIVFNCIVSIYAVLIYEVIETVYGLACLEWACFPMGRQQLLKNVCICFMVNGNAESNVCSKG